MAKTKYILVYCQTYIYLSSQRYFICTV